MGKAFGKGELEVTPLLFVNCGVRHTIFNGGYVIDQPHSINAPKPVASNLGAGSKAEDNMGMSTFQTRFSRDSSKNNILGSLNDFFVSAKPVNHTIASATGSGEMRR